MSVTLNFQSHLHELFMQALDVVLDEQNSGQAGLTATAGLSIERSRQASHGDYACNLAMQLAKPLRKSPRDIAQALIAALPGSEVVEKVEIAGAGFINVFITATAKQAVVKAVLQAGDAYGRGTLGAGRKAQVEFVSANPTGPLHVGHGRGAAYGASLANVLDAAGYRVSREYYVNDAGRQMDILALSTWLRYLELHGAKLVFPGNAYQGGYVRDMAQQVKAAHGAKYLRTADEIMHGVPPLPDAARDDKEAAQERDAHLDALIANCKKLLGEDYAYIHNHALTEQLGDCRNDLAEFGVHFDEWFSEQSLFDAGLVARVVETLKRNKHLYQRF